MNFLPFLQKNRFIIDFISKYSKRAYFVGGSVRDLLLGKDPSDIDIEIYDINKETFEKLAQKLGAIGIGQSFFVYKFKNYDLSLPRTENKIAPTHQGFQIALTNDEKTAAKRRDFTINAMMIDIFTGDLKDFYGGLDDLKNRRLKYIDKDSFQEDSLRVLRGVRFASQLNFFIEKNTQFVMKSMNLEEVSKERILAEFEKIAVLNPSLGLINLYKTGVLRSLFKIECDFEKIFKVASLMNFHDKTKLKNYKFFFIFFNEFSLPIKQTFEFLKAPKIYRKMLLNSPYKLILSDEELLNLSIDMPICDFLGSDFDDIEARAKKFGVWDKKFMSDFDVDKILKNGYKNKQIAQQITKEKKAHIKRILNG